MSITRPELTQRAPEDRARELSSSGATKLGGMMLEESYGDVKPQQSEDVEGMAPPSETIQELFERRERLEPGGWLIEFVDLPPNKRAYNASDIFLVGEGEAKVPHMLVRIEEKNAVNGEFTSQLGIYECSPDGKKCWPATNSISNLEQLTQGAITQDPGISYVNGKWALTWVEVEPNDLSDPTKGSRYKSVIAIGDDLNSLKRLEETTQAEDGTELTRNIELQQTKGLRFVGLSDGRIGICTRPEIDGKKTICFTVANSWEEVNTELLRSAQEIEGLSVEGAWPGGNDMQPLANGDVSLLLHEGHYVEKEGVPKNRRYEVAHCVVTPGVDGKPAQAKYLEIIATIEDFGFSVEEVPPMNNRQDIEDVVYPGSLIIDPRGGPTTLLASLRDATHAGRLIPDVLRRWRRDHPEYANAPFPPTVDQNYPIAA